MLCTIDRGNVEGYNGGQRPILHLVANAEAIDAAGHSFVFTDGHAAMEISKFYSDLNELNVIDWTIMTARYWSDTKEDGDRSRRRQAEFLVRGFLPWAGIHTVGTIDRATAEAVRDLLEEAEHRPDVRIQPDWYY